MQLLIYLLKIIFYLNPFMNFQSWSQLEFQICKGKKRDTIYSYERYHKVPVKILQNNTDVHTSKQLVTLIWTISIVNLVACKVILIGDNNFAA